MNPDIFLKNLDKGKLSQGTLFGQFISRRHGMYVRHFGPLIGLASEEIRLLENAYITCLASGSASSFGEAQKHIKSLSLMAESLPHNDYINVMLELDRRSNSLLARNGDFDELLARLALERSTRIATVTASEATRAQMIGRLGKIVRAYEESDKAYEKQLFGIWQHFSTYVSHDSPAFLAAVDYVAKNAASLQDLAKSSASVTKRAQQFMGHLSSVRGFLGEGYAFLSPKWLERVKAFRVQAERAADGLGSGHTVHLLDQTEHRIMLNGAPSVDQMIAILNPGKGATGIAYGPLRAQVKIAGTSEAIPQTINDAFRNAGFEAGLRQSVPIGVLDVTRGGQTEAYTLLRHPDVSETLVIINARGGKIPRKDLAELQARDVLVEEIILDLSVDDFSAIAAVLMKTVVL